MSNFWKVAVGVAGIGAIAFYVFNNLYERILGLSIFSSLSSTQTFIVVLLMLCLVFAALAIGLFAWLRKPDATPPGNDSISIGIPQGSTFANVAKAIASEAESAIDFCGFTESELQTPISPGPISGSSSERALVLLDKRAEREIRNYDVKKEDGMYVLTVKE